MSGKFNLRRLRDAAGCILLLALAGCAQPAVPITSVSAVPAGMARIWFYRDYEPSVSLNMANVGLNGGRVASLEADGSALYRNVAPGRYHITVESYGMDVNQAQDVDLASGQEAFAKILAQAAWENGNDINSFQRDTFYVRLVPEQLARADIANRRLSGG